MIFYSDNIQKFSNTKTAGFGFELKNIQKGTDQSTELIFKKAISWHKKFYTAISNSPVEFTIEYKLRNDTLTKNVRIALIFYLISSDEICIKTDAEQLLKEFSDIFQTYEDSFIDTYLFEPIQSKKHFDEFHTYPIEKEIFDYNRKPVLFKQMTGTIGYKSDKNNLNTLEFVPQFFIPDIFSLQTITQRLVQATDFLELSLYLTPIELNNTDLKDLKDLPKNYYLDDEHFTNLEKENYSKHLEMLFDDNTAHFLFHVRLTKPSAYLIGQSLHNTIADTFFGNIFNVEIKNNENDNFSLLNYKNNNKSLLKYLYPQEILYYTFHLPILTDRDIDLLYNYKTNIFNYFPSELPDEGILMGIKKSGYKTKEVRISEHDLARHIYILGQTGVGKTTMLKTMIKDQINKGSGVCIVDPHGDLIASIRSNIPLERENDVIFFDPTQTKDIKINILEYHPAFPEQKTFIFNELIKILNEIYDLKLTGGPMFEQYLKNGLLLIMEVGGTLKDLYRLFLEPIYRKSILENSSLIDCVKFFRNAEDIKGDYGMESLAPYITSKFNRFVQDDFIGPIISEKVSTINFRDIIDQKKILLIRLPKGRLGSDGVKFLGTLLFNRIIMASFTRENIPSKQRIPFYMYIDEFQNFTTEDIETALSESRKYGLRLILANQTLSQLRPDIIKIILGNVGSQIIFRPGPFDIETLSPYFKHNITEKELLGLKNFQAVARLLNNDTPMQPFIFETINR
jgi:hypothetical protein